MKCTKLHVTRKSRHGTKLSLYCIKNDTLQEMPETTWKESAYCTPMQMRCGHQKYELRRIRVDETCAQNT